DVLRRDRHRREAQCLQRDDLVESEMMALVHEAEPAGLDARVDPHLIDRRANEPEGVDRLAHSERSIACRAPRGVRSLLPSSAMSQGRTLKSVCVFCGSRPGADPAYAAAAADLGRAIAEREMTLVYGGAKVGL